MAKILLINPNKWGRGVTAIWIASHSSTLKAHGHDVKLFDCTFYKTWADDEVSVNTKNNQYQETDYKSKIKFKNNNVKTELQNLINNYEPDVIFWSAISSHINGEGEYVNLQYGYELVCDLNYNGLLVTGGIQGTGAPEKTLAAYQKINYLITGESELVLLELVNSINNKEKIKKLSGVNYYNKKDGKIYRNTPQPLIENLDKLGVYDYEIFEDQMFYRPYNGKVVRAIDYELSRGCIYTCSYCVETVIQNYYGFKEKTKNGALIKAKNYLRAKSANRIYKELEYYKKKLKIDLVRCQDTNFLTIEPSVLKNLEKLLLDKPLNLKLYIETRPEGINDKSVVLLKNLGVDGIGMGIEVENEEFREKNLNRFVKQKRIIDAFNVLKKNNIKRTTYNIIGLSGQSEEDIKRTIEFNKLLKPDNITVHYYSPYIGTDQERKTVELATFSKNQKHIDSRLRSVEKKNDSQKKLSFYMNNFVNMVNE
jgi:anaerobic magnesium-protoporphyrin IX monomethyl ester cyclase